MTISIKDLDKAAVFQAFYNYANRSVKKASITLEESNKILAGYKSTEEGKGPLYFKYFNAKKFFKHENHACGYLIKIDFSKDEIDTTAYDTCYGEGQGAKLIRPLRAKAAASQSADHLFFERSRGMSTIAENSALEKKDSNTETPTGCTCVIL